MNQQHPMDMEQYQKKEQQKKLENYKGLNQYIQKQQILFTGSSLMEQFPISELSQSLGLGKIIYNRGVGGFTTDDFLLHMDPLLFDLEPSKVFLNIGTNDMKPLPNGSWMEHLLSNYALILDECRMRLPDTAVYCMAYYPVNASVQSAQQPHMVNMLKVRTNGAIGAVNERIAHLADSRGYTYINVNDGLTDQDGNLKAEFTVDGIHMYSHAYGIIYRNLLPWL